MSCPDGGACHHECARFYRGACWRVFNAEPLSAAGWGRSWPEEIREEHFKRQTTRQVPVRYVDPRAEGHRRWTLKAVGRNWVVWNAPPVMDDQIGMEVEFVPVDSLREDRALRAEELGVDQDVDGQDDQDQKGE